MHRLDADIPILCILVVISISFMRSEQGSATNWISLVFQTPGMNRYQFEPLNAIEIQLQIIR